MFRKSLLLLCLGLANAGFTETPHCGEKPIVECCEESRDELLMEVKGSYFLSTNPLFRDTFHATGMYGLEFSYSVMNPLYLWVSGDAYYKKGHTPHFHSTTKLLFVPLGFGIKFLIPCKWVDFYVGGGVLETYAHFKDSSPYVIHVNRKWHVGAIIKAGFLVNTNRKIFFDFFSDYSFQRIPFHNSNHGLVYPQTANLSGFNFGLGLGYRLGNYTPPK